jgi:pimeloyl-ACP methyl ester carboxylesterase
MTESIEHVARFGEDLVGIMTIPAQMAPGAPACLLLNTGVMNRIGPHRLNVKIARGLAAVGVPSLRLDLSGLGDSPAAKTPLRADAQAVADLQAAMDHVQQTLGIDRFVVFGLCSGAVNGYRLALADPRVRGQMMFDGFVFPTYKTALLRRWIRLRRMSWAERLRKLRDRLLLRSGRPAPRRLDGDGLLDVQFQTPSREEFAQSLETLIRRGTDVFLFYSGSYADGHNYHGQLRDAFGDAMFLQHARYDYMADVDHTLTPVETQRRVIAVFRDWVQLLAGKTANAT